MRKITNLLVCLVLALLASTNAVWAEQYFKVHIVATDGNGNTMNNCNVWAGPYGDEPEDDFAWGQGEYTSDALEDSWGGVDINLYAKAPSGYEFLGWYADKDCNKSLDYDGLDATESEFNYYYSEPDDIDLPLAFSMSSSAASAPVTTVYAKFGVATTTYYYKVRVYRKCGSSSNGGSVCVTNSSSTPSSGYKGNSYNDFGPLSTKGGNEVDIYLYARNANCYEFVGWYTNSTCTTPLTFNGNDYTQANGCHYYYTPEQKSSAPLKIATKTSSSGNYTMTPSIYAKFNDTFVQEYYNVHVQAICDGVNIGGKVYAEDGNAVQDIEDFAPRRHTAQASSAKRSISSNAGLNNYTSSEAFSTDRYKKVYIKLSAEASAGYVFIGWYADAACTKPLNYHNTSYNKWSNSSFEYYYTPDEDKSTLPLRCSVSTSGNSAPVNTIYAKFQKLEYYKVRVQAASENGQTAGGKVFVSNAVVVDEGDDIDDGDVIIIDAPQRRTSVAKANSIKRIPSGAQESSYTSSAFPTKGDTIADVYLYAEANDGYTFIGWYADAACTIPLSFNGNTYTNHDGCRYYYKSSDMSMPKEFSTAATSGAAPVNTIYAKFHNHTAPYYAEVRYPADDNTPKRGGYYPTENSIYYPPYTATIPYNGVVSYNGTDVGGSKAFGNYPDKIYSYYSIPARGYRHKEWEFANVTYHASVNTSRQVDFKFTSNSTDADHPAVVTLNATYEELNLKTLAVSNKEGEGTINFKVRNWVENADGTGLVWTTIDLGTTTGHTPTDFSFYNTDSLIVTATPAKGYQFREWVRGRIKTDSNGDENIDEQSVYDNPNPYRLPGSTSDQWLYAYFDKQHHHYYAAEAEASKGGTVKVSFTDPIPADATETVSGQSGWTIDESTEITVYAQATPKEGYRFVGWKTSPSGAMVSFDANYSTTFAATSQTESSPSTLKLYAYFQKDGEVQAKIYDQMGEVKKEGTFDECLTNVRNNQTIVLYQNVPITGAKTINYNITIDFNGYTISGTTGSLFTINSGKTVTFIDNSESRAGGISVTTNTTADFTGIFVKGTLNFYGGEIRCTNTSTTSTNPTRAIRVDGNGSTLNLQGGNIITNVANQKAHGVGVFNTGTALLESGSVSATAAKGTAYGVVTNGSLTVTWSVAINATVTSGNDATGVRVSNTNNYSNKTVTISGGTITATASGSNAYAIHVVNSIATLSGNMAAIAEAGTATTAYALYEENANSNVTVETGRFKSNNTKDVNKAAGTLTLKGGYYAHNANLNTYKQASVDIADLQPGTKFYDEGYRFILTDGENPNYVVATANGKNFGSVADAILYANNNSNTEMTILLTVPEATLPAGNYTIPAKATLLVPYKANQEPKPVVERTGGVAFVTPKPFCKLTFESGVHMDVYGTIETGALQSAQGQSNAANGAPTRAFGWILMNDGCEIVVANGAEIRAWGYITGNGTIDVRRGGVVHEMFQILDWKGGTNTSTKLCGSLVHMAAGTASNEGDVFPMNQYFIQNIESPTTYRPGAVLTTATGLFMGGVLIAADKVQLIGVRNHINGDPDDVAMFLMDDEDDSEDTWVRKYYDVAADRQVYEVNNSAALGNLTIDLMGEYYFPSANFTLPFTNNMTVHLLSGEMSLGQNSVCLAGMQIEIDKLSTFRIPDGDSLYLYDSDQWDYYVFDGYYAQRVKYTPSLGGAPTARLEGGSKTTKPGDAVINLKGTMLVEGAVYTTAGGANIYSTNEDAGTVTFSGNDAPSETAKVCQWIGHGTNSSEFKYSDCPSALLKNADGTFTTTASTAAETSFCYINGAWRNMVVEDCFVKDLAATPVKYYAKPKEYVELVKQRETEGNYIDLFIKENHTYDYATSWNKGDTVLIITDDCQWWKVVPIEEDDKVFHCTHPDNDKYYYYDDDESWVEKRCTVTWNNYDGTVIESYTQNYKSTPKYLGTNPQRAMNDYYTYDFTGWTPEFAPVTRDITYTAQFEQKDRRYLVTFLDADGTELETSLWKMGEVPSCVNQPTPQGKILNWEPAIRAVSGDAIYRATYTDQLKSAYTVTFVNWNGEELQSGSVATGTIPSYSGATPAKASIQDEAYAFAGWTPDITAVSADAVYTATFTPAPARYTITFKRKVSNDGVGTSVSPAVEIETQELGYGELPVCSNPPVKNPTAAEYYEVIWTPQISSVTGDATYTATGFTAYKNTLRLTVSAGANGSVSVTKGGTAQEQSAVYEAGTAVVLTATPNTGYQFVRWSDGNTSNPRDLTVNATTTLKAEFAVKTYTITWKDYDNSALGTTTIKHGEIPTRPAPARADAAGKHYTFNGWTPAVAAATANTTYTATYTEETLTYTIRFVLNNGLADIVQTKSYGDAVSIDDPTPATVGEKTGTFSGWTNSNGTTYAKGETLPNVTNNEVYSAQYELSAPEIILTAGTSEEADAKDINISTYGTNVTASTLIIEEDGSATIPAGTSLQVENFILESNTNKSGQLIGGSRINVTGNAYFDLTINAKALTWYAVAVPWDVDAASGIIVNGSPLRLVTDIDVLYYDGASRAANGTGAGNWKYIANGSDKTMHPGTLYMIYLANPASVIRFQKKGGASISTTTLSVQSYPSNTGTDVDAGWNGIANPSLFHAFINPAADTYYGDHTSHAPNFAQKYMPDEVRYDAINLSSHTLIVGEPIFVQVNTPNTISAYETKSGAGYAPRRSPRTDNAYYEVQISGSEEYTDRIYLQTLEDKEDCYMTGLDLAKAGISPKVAQMWVNRYNAKLCVNTTAPVGNTANYPLGISVPENGTYQISSATEMQANQELYVTRNGSAIWNLAYGPYTVTLDKGTYSEYGIKLILSNAPAVTTGVDQTQTTNDKLQIQKVLIDNKVYIVREGELYTITGQKVQ